MRTWWMVAVVVVGMVSGVVMGGDVVPVGVGAGSYASGVPETVKAKTRAFAETDPIFVAEGETRPIPTNKWWTYFLHKEFGGNNWAYPVTTTADKTGFALYFPTEWKRQDMALDHPIHVTSAAGFSSAIVKDWSDWTVTFELGSGASGMDVTTGHGLPWVWVENKGIAPTLDFDEPVTFFDDAGGAVSLPMTGDHVGVLYHGRSYGIFAANGTVFSLAGNSLSIGNAAYVVVGVMTGKGDLGLFHQYAYNRPTGTQVSWKYDPAAGRVDTTWTVTTKNLKGEAGEGTIQGFIPHHYKNALEKPAFIGKTYAVVNGKMECATGSSFHFAYRFTGILPLLPAPADVDGANPYLPDRMQALLATYMKKAKKQPKGGGDTYWGGKDVLNFPKFALIAQWTKDPAYDELRKFAAADLSNWLTYTPGEKDHYFARYDRWHAMVGFSPSYGSETFTDNHFHYGYFTHAGALMSMLDPEFLGQYGGMLTLVAKQYANWDRKDLDFPFFRTFDPWVGHSWAGGASSANGDNQESSSEATQSWAGEFLLGSALGNDAMRDAAAFGYVSESRATQEYWLDVDHENLPPSYGHHFVGVVYAAGLNYGTFFSGDPHHIHGIQWLPISPYLNYLAQNKAYAAADYESVLQEMRAKGKGNDITAFGADWANVYLSYQQLYDPDKTAKEFDEYWDANQKLARDQDTAVLTYYFTHAHRSLGELQWDAWSSLPTSNIYLNTKTGKLVCVAWNPKETAQTATVYKAGQSVGSVTIAARSLEAVAVP